MLRHTPCALYVQSDKDSIALRSDVRRVMPFTPRYDLDLAAGSFRQRQRVKSECFSTGLRSYRKDCPTNA